MLDTPRFQAMKLVPELDALVELGRQRGLVYEAEIDSLFAEGSVHDAGAGGLVLQTLFDAGLEVKPGNPPIPRFIATPLIALEPVAAERQSRPIELPVSASDPTLAGRVAAWFGAELRFWAQPLLYGTLAALLLYVNWFQYHRAVPLPPPSVEAAGVVAPPGG